jgi:hypothetical protein
MSVTYEHRVLDLLISNAPDQLDQWVRAVGEEMVGDVKMSFGTSPAGERYVRRSVTHIASQAGYPPNVDTGALRASIRVDKVSDLHYRLHDGVKYGYWLEIGTPKMRKRPFILPVVEKWRTDKLFRHAIQFGLVVKLVK